MRISCDHCPLREYEVFDELTQDEISFMARFKTGELEVEANTTLLMEGNSSPQLFTVLSGMGLRYKTLPDGRRQIINFVFPGDFLGLQAGIMGEMSHTVEATTDMRLCVFKRADIWTLFKQQPSRAYDIVWISAVEEYFLGDTLATVGRRDAMEKVAWAFLRIYERLESLGMTEGSSCPLPYRQQDLSDALGLSLVHTNKTIQKLRHRQIASWQNGTLTLHDPGRLAEIAAAEIGTPPTRPLI